MTMHEESRSPSFADDLHKVAMTFDAPNTEFLYGSAVTRGRAIKRRRAFQGAFGAVVALVAAGALGLALAGGTSGHAVPSASDSVARPTASAGPITGKYMLESFKALLPGDVKIDPADGSATLYGVSFAVYGTSGGWTASAYTAAKINGPVFPPTRSPPARSGCGRRRHRTSIGPDADQERFGSALGERANGDQDG